MLMYLIGDSLELLRQPTVGDIDEGAAIDKGAAIDVMQPTDDQADPTSSPFDKVVECPLTREALDHETGVVRQENDSVTECKLTYLEGSE
jgi:hypothetical protein